MTIQATLKRVGFKPGRSEQPGVVAEIVLICDEPSQVLELVEYVSQPIVFDVQGVQQRLPLDEPTSNGTVEVSAGRRRRGTRATVTEDQ